MSADPSNHLDIESQNVDNDIGSRSNKHLQKSVGWNWSHGFRMWPSKLVLASPYNWSSAVMGNSTKGPLALKRYWTTWCWPPALQKRHLQNVGNRCERSLIDRMKPKKGLKGLCFSLFSRKQGFFSPILRSLATHTPKKKVDAAIKGLALIN